MAICDCLYLSLEVWKSGLWLLAGIQAALRLSPGEAPQGHGRLRSTEGWLWLRLTKLEETLLGDSDRLPWEAVLIATVNELVIGLINSMNN